MLPPILLLLSLLPSSRASAPDPDPPSLSSPPSSISQPKSPENRPEDGWQCAIRSWTRAPDLAPGRSVTGDTRLAAEGSGCADIEGWDVGLRLLERGVVKKRNPNAPPTAFPARPTRPPRNASAPRVDWNDIYLPQQDIIWDRDDEGYSSAVAKYSDAIRNRSLWEVHGVERVVFDIKHKLPFTSDGSHDVDVVQSFAIHAPPTNFPPIESRESHGASQGKEEQLLNTETLFEYYHLIHLRNGSTVDVPAGRAGFLPRQHPVSLPTADKSSHLNLVGWPRTTTLQSPRKDIEQKDEADMLVHFAPKPPACDQGSLALFNVSISSQTPYPVQGENIALNVTLTRTGNGSEYPAFIDFRHSLDRSIHWARQYLSSEEEYAALVSQETGHRVFRPEISPPKMLMVKSRSVMEQERESQERRRDKGAVSTSSTHHAGRWPVGRDGVRRDFEELEEEYRDEYRFQVVLPILYDGLPSFSKTFEDLRSSIGITLHTTYTCTDQKHSAGSEAQDQIDDPPDFPLADEWEEYSLPLRPSKSKRRLSAISIGSYFQHRGLIPFDLRPSSHYIDSSTNQDANRGPCQDIFIPKGKDGKAEIKDVRTVLHYTDPLALAPAFSRSINDPVEFGRVGHTLREEWEHELVKSRYTRRNTGRTLFASRSGGRGGIGGGAEMHAAKIWEGVEGRKTEKERERVEMWRTEVEREVAHQANEGKKGEMVVDKGESVVDDSGEAKGVAIHAAGDGFVIQ